MSVTAVVPLRDGHSGKSRLASTLGPRDRGLLVAELARHVVTTLLDVADVAEVVVVTEDPGFVSRTLGPAVPRLRVVSQPTDRPGLNAAVDVGREVAPAGPDGRVLVVHADLPALSVADVRALLASPAPVVLAPDRRASGTNAVVLDAPAAGFRTRFGPDSFAAHRREAERLGLDVAVVTRAGTSVDLDVIDDWSVLAADVRERVARAVPVTATLGGAGGVPGQVRGD